MNTARTNNRFHRIFRLILIVPLVLPGLLPARQTSQGEHARGEKIRLILHLQDQRVEHSDTLIRFFHDPDPVVRARVALSYGSLQDTSVLPFLLDLLSDQDSEVERNAAFAVGQTAGLISENSRVSLQHDLLHRRLDNMKSDTATGRSPVDRCIEEIGKFGDEQTLRELVSRFAAGSVVLHRYALIMSIARFAIRGITDSVATEFLIRSSREDSAVSSGRGYRLRCRLPASRRSGCARR